MKLKLNILKGLSYMYYDKFWIELSKSEKIGELAFQTVNFIDMMQTLEIVQHSNLTLVVF